jgi:hypothetical protein
MEFRGHLIEYENLFSQERPVLFSPRYLSAAISHGWRALEVSLKLDACRMHQVSRNSSIHLYIVVLWALLVAPAASAQISVGRSLPQVGDKDQVKKVADNFEAMMLGHMYGEMEKSPWGEDSQGPFAQSPTEKLYRSWLNSEIMGKMAQSRPLKIGDLVEDQLNGKVGIRRRTLVK